MGQYKRRPHALTAKPYKPGMEDGFDYPNPAAIMPACLVNGPKQQPFVINNEQRLFINEDDWIVTGLHGERYPVNKDIFKDLYEPVCHKAALEWRTVYA